MDVSGSSPGRRQKVRTALHVIAALIGGSACSLFMDERLRVPQESAPPVVTARRYGASSPVRCIDLIAVRAQCIITANRSDACDHQQSSIASVSEAGRSVHDHRWHSAAQGLLKEQLEVVKYKTEAGVLRYTIRPLDVELPFDKVTSWVCAVGLDHSP